MVTVGSGVACGRWVDEAEDFLKKFRKEFEGKKLALFVSSLEPISKREGQMEEVAKMRKLALEDKVAKFSLKPVSVGSFGGIIDFNRMGFIMRKGMEVAFKEPLQRNGFKEVKSGSYDLHDWDEIRKWAVDLAKQAREYGDS